LRLICNHYTFGRALAFWGMFTSFLLLPAYLSFPDTQLDALTLRDLIPFAGVALLSLLVALASPAQFEITVNPDSKTWAVKRRQLLGFTRSEEHDVGGIRQVSLNISPDGDWADFTTQWGETFKLTAIPVTEALALCTVESFSEATGLSYQKIQVT
jgi:hypothetical protein